MTRLEHSAELVCDIRDCAVRARSLGFTVEADELTRTAHHIEYRLTQGDSIPPVLASNQEARATASKHFQEARRLLKGISR